MLTMPTGILPDVSTYHRVERGIALHDTGRIFEKLGIVNSEEHHFASLFFALHADGDPAVCQAILDHVKDVFPRGTSVVSKFVRAFDRLAGAGFIGLIRESARFGFTNPMFEEKDEDKIIKNGVMVTFSGVHSSLREEPAEEFFWDNVYPFFSERGTDGLVQLATLCKIALDRIVGRDFRGRIRKLSGFERQVLEMDRGAKVVDPIPRDIVHHLDFKARNTLNVLVKSRREIIKLLGGESDYYIYGVLTPQEYELYRTFGAS